MSGGSNKKDNMQIASVFILCFLVIIKTKCFSQITIIDKVIDECAPKVHLDIS